MDKNEFIQYVRRYPTNELLYFMSKLSIEMYYENQPIKFEKLPYYYKNGIKACDINFIYTQHELLNLCYYSILFGNDYRQNKIEKKELIDLLDKLKRYNNDCSANDTRLKEKYKEYFAILFNEQIQFQRINLSIELFDRLYFIMTYINKNYTNYPDYIDFEKETLGLINMTIEEYNEINLFLTLLVIAIKNPNLTDMLNNITFNFYKFKFDKHELNNLINMDSNNYEYYRNIDCGNINWNFLKYSPLVKTNKTGNILMVNIYSYIICFSSKIYWLIRNKYKNINSQ